MKKNSSSQDFIKLVPAFSNDGNKLLKSALRESMFVLSIAAEGVTHRISGSAYPEGLSPATIEVL